MQVPFIRTKTVFDEAAHRQDGRYVVESVTHRQVMLEVDDEYELVDSEWIGEFIHIEFTHAEA